VVPPPPPSSSSSSSEEPSEESSDESSDDDMDDQSEYGDESSAGVTWYSPRRRAQDYNFEEFEAELVSVDFAEAVSMLSQALTCSSCCRRVASRIFFC
jgi:hypothetical protein